MPIAGSSTAFPRMISVPAEMIRAVPVTPNPVFRAV
jgi:hypothetical protein